MSGDELPPLPNDIGELLASARRLEGPTTDVRARLRARIASTLPPSPGGGGGDAHSAGTSGEGLARWVRAPWWSVAAAFVVGAFAGRLSLPSSAIAVRAPATTENRVATAEVPPSSDVGQVPALSISALPEAPALAPPTYPPAANPARSTGSPGDLAIERRLLDVARTALGRDNGAEALAACEEHARRFPRGALAEEREAIAVQALVESNRHTEARERGERFQRSYPRSILLPVVLAALESQP